MIEPFNTRGFIPGGCITNAREQTFNVQALPPFLRALLVTDGTVTKILEAFFWEGVRVETLEQHLEQNQIPVAPLSSHINDMLWSREVRLRGEHTGSIYAHAKSLLKLENLPEHLQRDIQSGRIGIGELLRECNLETYRELLDVGFLADHALAHLFEDQECASLVYRDYRIVIDGRPTILITEHFPLNLYAKCSE